MFNGAGQNLKKKIEKFLHDPLPFIKKKGYEILFLEHNGLHNWTQNGSNFASADKQYLRQNSFIR